MRPNRAGKTEGHMATEFEIKLRAQNAQQLKTVLQDREITALAQGRLREVHMKTCYFDTADGALSARKWMLRVRQENEKSVVTMKTPGKDHARGEWECEGKTPEAAIETLILKGAPQALRELVSPGLRMVCGASFVRLTQTLLLPDGTTCEVCADGGELLGGHRKEPFFELELELTRGKPETLVAYAQKISRKFGLQEEEKSKFVRARRLADGK